MTRLLLPLGIWVIAYSACAAEPISASIQEVSSFRPGQEDVVRIKGWPVIGKWMMTPDLQPAHWLGALVRGRTLREPINVVVIDSVSKTAEDARRRLRSACEKAGFPSRFGHSSGYWAWVGDALRPQVPDEKGHAFSDEPFEFTNNHGRFFGPFRDRNRYLFVGAFSREKVQPLAPVKHQYVSFNAARDRFAAAMEEQSGYRLTGFLKLDNALIGRADRATGDHDHMAAVLTATP